MKSKDTLIPKVILYSLIAIAAFGVAWIFVWPRQGGLLLMILIVALVLITRRYDPAWPPKSTRKS